MEGFERGRKLKKMGLHSQDTTELFFNDVKVPKNNVLGNPTEGFKYLARFLAQERLVAAIGFMATAQTAFDITLEYVRSEEHTTELQSLMPTPYAVFCLKKKICKQQK